jgi:hypothetical protein
MLKKAHAAALLLALLTCADAFAQQAMGPAAGWEKFNSTDGRFSVHLPGKPAFEAKEVDSPIGKLTLHAYSASNNRGYFLASFGDYPSEPKDAAQIEKVLDSVADGVLKGLGAELISEVKKISLGANSGREFSAKKAEQGMQVVFTWRIYLVGRRLYQLAAVTKESDAKSSEVSKFLTSFDITK